MSVKELGLYIGGEWREAEGGSRFADVDPFTGETVASAPADVNADGPRERRSCSEWTAGACAGQSAVA